MGYTNYWYQYEDFTQTEWDCLKAFYQGLEKTFVIQDETYKADSIQFNGTKGDDHETFVLNRYATKALDYSGHNPAFNFCKTARKNYDAVVWSLLCYARYLKDNKDSFVISNDDGEDLGKPCDECGHVK